jgi:hypothetical protein
MRPAFEEEDRVKLIELVPSGLNSAAFSPDGKSVLTGTYDGKARLFRNFSELPDELERVYTAWASSPACRSMLNKARSGYSTTWPG